LAGELEKCRSDVDNIAIGLEGYKPTEEDESSTMADTAKMITGVSWLVPGWIPLEMLSGIIAQPKMGKSLFALLGLIRPLTTGCKFFNGTKGPKKPRNVVYLETDRAAAMNVERMGQFGVPMERVINPFKDCLEYFSLENDDHIERVKKVASRYEAPLIVLDCLRSSHSGNENDSRLHGLLNKFADISISVGSAAFVIHHTKIMRLDEDMTINAGRGSNAFLAAVKAQLALSIPDPRPDLKQAWRKVELLGENLGVNPGAFGFRVVSDDWELGPSPKRPPREDKQTKGTNAKGWLQQRLACGDWIPSAVIFKEGEALGFSGSTVKRAKQELEVNSHKGKAGWDWRLTQPNQGA
jgi:hypothetical protein